MTLAEIQQNNVFHTTELQNDIKMIGLSSS